MNEAIEIGRLLRAGTTGFIAGCRVNQLDTPAFGALIRVPLGEAYQVFGLIHDIHIDDDGLVRQLVTADSLSAEVLRDNRERRIVPIELSIVTVGYEQDGRIHHSLPPRPPLSLDAIYLCGAQDLVRFTSSGSLGYFRHIVRAEDVPVSELLAAHVRQVAEARPDGVAWRDAAVREIISLLRDDYPTIISVMSALSDAP